MLAKTQGNNLLPLPCSISPQSHWLTLDPRDQIYAKNYEGKGWKMVWLKYLPQNYHCQYRYK